MEFKTLKPIFKHLFNLFVLCTASFAAVADVQLVEGHVRAMPASVPNTAAYLTLKNIGEAKMLTSVTTNVAREAQLHTMLMEEGVMKMRQVAHFELPENGNLALTPSGNHIMVIGLKQPLTLDQKIMLSLKFDDGETLTVTLPVKNTMDDAMPEHHHHH